MDPEFDLMFGPEPKKEKLAAGTLGALLGSLAGVVCIILISRLNVVASVSGLVMAVCALKGYEKLAGELTKKGAVISCVIIVIMTYFAHHLDITIEIMQELDMPFFEAFGVIPKFLRLDILDRGVFWGNLALLYLFTLMGAIPTIRRSLIPSVPPYLPAQNAPMSGMQPGPTGGMPAASMGNQPAASMGTAQPVQPGGMPAAPTGTTQPVLPGGISAESAQAAQAAFVQSTGMYAVPASDAQAVPGQNAQAAQPVIEFFPADRHMTAKPRYGGLGVALFLFVTGMLLFVGGSVVDTDLVSPILGGLVMIVCSIFIYAGAMVYVPDTMFLFARVNGTLWRINLEQLNQQMGYHFTNSVITLTGVRWHKLAPEEQQRAKNSIQYLITVLDSAQSTQAGMFELPLALCLSEPVVLKETRWAWKISYLANNGKRRKLTIHKSYPGFAPAPGFQPAQRPVPFRWRGVIISLIIVLLFGGLFLAVDISEASRSPRRDVPLRVSTSELDRQSDPDMRPEEEQRPDADQHPDTDRRPDADASSSVPETDSSADLPSGTVEITWDNYQLLFHHADEYGYQYIAVGYLPVPPEVFGENVFADAYVPDCDAPVYSEDGYTLTAAAHGMLVDVTIMPSEGNARDVVDAMFDAFAASGADIYEDGVAETEYNEEYGIAVKQVFYFEENHTLPRMCFFYADEPFNGCCYAARIVYLTEQQDGEYPALVEELGDAFGLSLPVIDSFEP